MKQPEIVRELLTAINWYGSLSRRLRFAVSTEEYREIRNYCLDKDKRFFDRIGDVPLVIEDNPLNPLLTVETKPCTAI